VALKIELKPNERVMLGDCVVTNHSQRTRLTIDGKVAILRESDIMTLRQATTPAKRIYLAVQFMYLSKQPRDNYELYLRLAAEMLKALPKARPYIERIDDRVSAGDLYKALKEARKLIAFEKDRLDVDHAGHAGPKVASETAPREREASLLLNAAAKLQAVHDSWNDSPPDLDDAITYNRRLWSVFIDAVNREDNKLPDEVRKNLLRLGAYVMGETHSLMTKPKPEHLQHIIKVNRGIAVGLRGKA
jgi:flagellar biosynthesis repressor protein FlbT